MSDKISIILGSICMAGAASPLLSIGVLAFAVSDVAVARDRFVRPSLTNRVWGLPLYYAAQILFAMSVLSYR